MNMTPKTTNGSWTMRETSFLAAVASLVGIAIWFATYQRSSELDQQNEEIRQIMREELSKSLQAAELIPKVNQ
jgi:GAF domain-containing protein